jgi:hypothetical protein
VSHRITIEFPADRDGAFYVRVFCWADDTLHPGIQRAGSGVVLDVDHVRETVRIDVPKARHLGQVLVLIRKTLPQHFPGGEGTISRG